MNKYLRYLIVFGAALVFLGLFYGILLFPIISKFNQVLAFILLIIGSYVYAEGVENYLRKINLKLKYRSGVSVGDTVIAYKHLLDSTIVKIGKVEEIFIGEGNKKTYLIGGETFTDVSPYTGDFMKSIKNIRHETKSSSN